MITNHQSTNEFKIRNYLSINSDDAESISVEILFKNRKNTIFNVLYSQPEGQIEPLEKFLKEIFYQIKKFNRQFHVAGDFNLNVLDHEIFRKVQQFLNIIFENGKIPIINKPFRITNKITYNLYADTLFKTAVFKCEVPDHFPICLIMPSLKFYRRIKIFIFTKDHLMSNLSSILKRTFLKLIDKKLKLYKIHVMPTHIFRTIFSII